MTELKTLKDLQELGDVSREELRQEAIKWVKFYKKRYEETDGLNEFKYSQAVYIAFMKFFNLTEEDLKRDLK